MNLSHLEIFAAIVDTGSFSEAAERIGLTRSAVSHALANLEAELGVPLVERDRSGAMATTVGNCILQDVREILATVENIRQETSAARGLATGKLRIGIVSSISPAVWSGILRKFRLEHPGIEVVTFEGAGHEVEDWILNSIVDVGFVLRPNSAIDSVLIGSDEVQVLVPKDHPLRKRRSVTLEGISHEPFITPKIACDFLDSAWHGAGFVALQRRYEATEVQTLIAMVREGLGITLLPESLLPAQVDGLHRLSLEPPLRFSFGVGVRALRTVSPAARMFMLTAQLWAQANGFEPEHDPREDVVEAPAL